MKARSSMYIHLSFLRIRCMLINRNHLLFIRLNKKLSTGVNIIQQRLYGLLYNVTGKRKIRSPEFYLLLSNAAY